MWSCWKYPIISLCPVLLLSSFLSACVTWRWSDVRRAREPISCASATQLFSTLLARSLAHKAWLWSGLTLFDEAGCRCSSRRQSFRTMPCGRDAISYHEAIYSGAHLFLGVLKMRCLWSGRHLFTWVTTALLRQTKFSSNNWVTLYTVKSESHIPGIS